MRVIGVLAPNDDLRAWLLDELALMTSVGAFEVTAAANAEQLPLDSLSLLIVALPRMDAEDLDALRALRSRCGNTPVIAVGASPRDMQIGELTRVLGLDLTSRELKRAIRELTS